MSKQDYRELEAYRALGKPEELSKIIRCKDCVHYSMFRVNGIFLGCGCELTNFGVEKEDFCSFAKKCANE